MKTMSSQAIFVSLNKMLKRLKQQGDVKGLQKWLTSDAFAQDVLALNLDHRLQILGNSSVALHELKERIGPLLPMSNEKAPKWNEVQVARLRILEAKYEDDELVARALRLPKEAVARARRRYIGTRPEVAPATAAAEQAA